MDVIIQEALKQATIGQLTIAIQHQLVSNTEVKIDTRWVRVQHTSHNDRLLNAAAIDPAIVRNLQN